MIGKKDEFLDFENLKFSLLSPITVGIKPAPTKQKQGVVSSFNKIEN